jgi:hypothetical protein
MMRLAVAGQQHAQRGGGHRRERLPDRGERGTGPGRDGYVVEADHAQVARGAQAALAERLQDAERLPVVPGHNRGRRIGQVQQPGGHLPGPVRRQLAAADQPLVRRQAGFG